MKKKLILSLIMISLLTILSFVMMSSCYAKGITAGKGVIDIVAGGVLVANSAAHLSSSYNYGKTSNSNSSNSNSGDKKTPEYKNPISNKSEKSRSKDVPSWSKGNKSYKGASGNDFAKRLMEEMTGGEKYETGPASDYNRIKNGR